MARNSGAAVHDLQLALYSQYLDLVRRELSAEATAIAHEQYSMLQYAMLQQREYQSRYERLNQTRQKQQLDAGMNFSVQLGAKEIIQGTAKYAANDTAFTVGEIGRVYSKVIRDRRHTLSKINAEVAQLAIQSTVDRYNDEHGKRGRFRESSALPYRADVSGPNHRYAGGVLKSALASPLMAEAQVDGVSFLNETFLNAVAKQWYRLNFGAGARAHEEGPGGGNATTFQKYRAAFYTEALGKEALGSGQSLSLKRPASPSFYIPAGLWFSGSKGMAPSLSRRGSDQFVLDRAGSKLSNLGKSHFGSVAGGRFGEVGFQRRKVSRGIAAWSFLDAGIQSIAHNFPVAMADYLAKVFREGDAELAANIPNKLNVSTAQAQAALAGVERTGLIFRSAGGARGKFRRYNF